MFCLASHSIGLDTRPAEWKPAHWLNTTASGEALLPFGCSQAQHDLCLQAVRLEHKAEAWQAQLEPSMAHSEHWVAFERIVDVLLRVGALRPADERGMLAATTLGRVARDLQAQNPLWLALAMLQPAVQVRGSQFSLRDAAGRRAGMLAATALGRVARDLRAQNPLWLALAMLQPAVHVSL